MPCVFVLSKRAPLSLVTFSRRRVRACCHCFSASLPPLCELSRTVDVQAKRVVEDVLNADSGQGRSVNCVPGDRNGGPRSWLPALAGRAALVARKAPVKFVSRTNLQHSIVVRASARCGTFTPAAYTTTSSRPCADSAASTSRRPLVSSSKSAATTVGWWS